MAAHIDDTPQIACAGAADGARIAPPRRAMARGASVVCAVAAACLLSAQPATANPTYTFDDYLVFMIFDCTLPGTQSFDVEDARTAAQDNLGFEIAEEDGDSIRYRNADGAEVTITMSETAPSCTMALPAAVHETRPRDDYEYDALWATYEREHGEVDVSEGILGGLTYTMTIEWGYRVSANLRMGRDDRLIFSATTLNPD